MENTKSLQKPPTRQMVVFSVLHSYYPVVATLHSYLEEILHAPDGNNLVLQETDTAHYRSFLTTSYVAGDATLKREKHYIPLTPMVHMRDVSSQTYVFSAF